MRRSARFDFAAVLLAGLLLGVQAAAEPLQPARKVELNNLLLHDCGSCHGLTLKGGLGPPLLPQHLAAFSEEDLVAVILEGRPGTPMPPWGQQLSRDEAAWLARRMKRGRAE